MRLLFCMGWLVPLSLFAVQSNLSFTTYEQEYLQKHPVIRVCIDPSSMPYEVLSLEGKHEGIAADLLNLLAQRIGLSLEIVQTYTWEESLSLAKKNRCDIVSFMSQTLEHDEWLLFSEPFFIDKNVLITHHSHTYIDDLKYIPSGTIALPRGSALARKIENDFPKLTVFSVASEEDALLLVANQQVDMTIRPFATAAYSIKQQGLFSLKMSTVLNNLESVFRIGITQNNTVLREILNKGIRSIALKEKEGIVNRYIPSILHESMHKEIWYALVALFVIAGGVLLWNHMLRKEVKRAVAQNIENQKIMMQQAKKAELGELIGNISHQWREPLSHLSGINLMMIGLLEHGKEIGKPFLHQQLKSIENTLEFMSQTMQNFLEFYKPSTRIQAFNIASSIEQTLSLLETQLLADAIRVEIEGDKKAMLQGIKNEYMQIWLNLLSNSIHAFKETKTSSKIISCRIEKGYIMVCDNAGGTIKTDALLNGVGLRMCEQILEKYHQKLLLENTHDGVCVKILNS